MTTPRVARRTGPPSGGGGGGGGGGPSGVSRPAYDVITPPHHRPAVSDVTSSIVTRLMVQSVASRNHLELLTSKAPAARLN